MSDQPHQPHNELERLFSAERLDDKLVRDRGDQYRRQIRKIIPLEPDDDDYNESLTRYLALTIAGIEISVTAATAAMGMCFMDPTDPVAAISDLLSRRKALVSDLETVLTTHAKSMRDKAAQRIKERLEEN